MADKKISALTGATTPLAGTEVLPIVQGGNTVKVSVANLTAGRSIATNDIVASGELTSTTNNARISLYRSTGTNYFDWASGQTLAFGTQTSQGGAGRVSKVSFLDNGDVTNVTGNFVVGTAGKGIDFSANTHAAGMTSELLTWYEEGTWTPTDASGAGLSFVAVSGNYTRIGNTVFLFGYVRYPVTATTNTARIGGLPFTANSADSVAQGAVTYSQVATIRSVGVAKSTAILDVYTLAGGVPTNADLSNTVLYFNSTYFV